MPYIRQKQRVETKVETVIDEDNSTIEKIDLEIIVDTTEYVGSIEQHPALVENPQYFEYVNKELPTNYSTLNYVSNPNQQQQPVQP